MIIYLSKSPNPRRKFNILRKEMREDEGRKEKQRMEGGKEEEKIIHKDFDLFTLLS